MPQVGDVGPEAGIARWLDTDDQDPLLSMHDTQEESGDEAGVRDLYRIDTLEADQLGVALDSTGTTEPLLG